MTSQRPELTAAIAATTAAEAARCETDRRFWQQVAELHRAFVARRVWLEVIG